MAEDHKEVIKRMTAHWDADRDNRDDAVDDQKFRAGDQWPDAVRRQREIDGRPVITVNRMGQFIKRVSGSLRQSHPAIQPVPVDQGADEQLTEIMAGLIRHIEYLSRAGAVYAYGAECAIACGIGHWQVKTKYSYGSFDQDICIERTVDPLAVIWDSAAVNLDRSDADECYVTEWISKEARKKRFPKASESGTDLPLSSDTFNSSLYWQQDDKTRIASRWWRKPVKKTLGITADGQIFDLTKMPRVAIQSLGITRERVAEDYEIKHQVLDGDDYLTDEQSWAGRFIPVVPIIGEEIAFDDKLIRHGIIRWAKDPQRLYNYWRSAAAEMIALAPKAPFIVPMKSIAGLENFWARANSANLPYLPYNPVPPDQAAGDHRPQRQEGPQPPLAMWKEADVAQDDMKATTGVYDAALGAQGNESSGIAIQRRTQETDTGTIVYFDNFNHAIQRTGEILVDLIPKIYDGERVIRILGEDGKESFVPINRTVTSPDGPMLINDLSAGTYDVRIKTGPSYANAKEMAKQELGDIMKAQPQLMGLMGDIYVEALDLPADIGQKLIERLRKMLPPGLVPPEEGGMPGPQPDPRAEEGVTLDLQKKQADVAKTRAQADNTVLQNEKLAGELGLSGIELTPGLPAAGEPEQRPQPAVQ
jgi:hypothetical protein